MQKVLAIKTQSAIIDLTKENNHLKGKVNKMTTYREQYIEDMHMMDKNGNALTAEEKELLKEEYRRNVIDLGKEETLYFVALDFNVIVTVVRQLVEKP